MLASEAMGERPFELFEPPPDRETPVLVEVPHSGLWIPPEILARIDVPASSLARDADLYVHELYADAPLEGATLLFGTLSRYVVDLNRAEDDIDSDSVEGGPSGARAPRGVVWRLSGEGGRFSPSPFRAPSWSGGSSPTTAPTTPRFGGSSLGSWTASASPSSSLRTRCRATRAGLPGDRARARRVVPRERAGADNGRFTLHRRVEGHAVERRAGRSGMTSLIAGGFTTRTTVAPTGRPRNPGRARPPPYLDEARLLPHTCFPEVRAWCRALVAKLGQLALG